jgi:hypothetical protein
MNPNKLIFKQIYVFRVELGLQCDALKNHLHIEN